MGIGGTGNGTSARRNQATGELDLLDAPSSFAYPNQHYAVLHRNHHHWVFLGSSILIEIQATDPAAMINLGIPKRRA
jgi:hypothetical protein